MEKKIKLLPPMMPNFIFIEKPPRPRQEGISPDPGIPITDLSEEEAKEYAELMRNTFMEHYRDKLKQI